MRVNKQSRQTLHLILDKCRTCAETKAIGNSYSSAQLDLNPKWLGERQCEKNFHNICGCLFFPFPGIQGILAQERKIATQAQPKFPHYI
jgi:hypothetical protein